MLYPIRTTSQQGNRIQEHSNGTCLAQLTPPHVRQKAISFKTPKSMSSLRAALTRCEMVVFPMGVGVGVSKGAITS